MKRMLLLSVIILFLAGCASYFYQLTSKNNHITLPGVAFTAPDTGEWYVQYFGFGKQQAMISKQLGQSKIQILIYKAENLEKSDAPMLNMSAKEAADYYRNREKQTMIDLGVNKGQYIIKDLVMGEEKIGEKTFYTMDYLNLNRQGKVRASLYLYFPSPAQNNYFILTLFQEVTPPNTEIPDHKPIFIEVLKSISLTN